MEYVIETKALTKAFPRKVAAKDVEMHVEKGDIYGLIGKNGAGKTTTMKMILGMLRPTSGEIKLFGSENLAAERARIGSLIEAPGLYRNCTAFENMKRFSILFGGTDQEINELLDFVGLAKVGTRKVGAFSLGMKQRLGLALSLLGKPELLILDEPINGLDPAGIKEIRDIILRLNEERGVTFLISSHLLDELGKIATRYGIINDGELVEEVSSEDLKRRCRKGLVIKADPLSKAESIMRDKFGSIEYSVENNELVVNTDSSRAAEINEALVRDGVQVSELSVVNNDFEDYFIARLGKHYE